MDKLVSVNEDLKIDDEAIKHIHVVRPLSESLDVSKKIHEYYDEGPSLKAGNGGAPVQDYISKATHAWLKVDNIYMITGKPNADTIPAGMYDIKSSMQQGLYLENRSVLTDDLFTMNGDQVMGELLDEFTKFLAARAKYDEYGFTYKRGILMYGPQGCGKSSVINLMCQLIIEKYNGIIINMDYIDSFIAMAVKIRMLEKDRPILALIEDFDGFLNMNSTKQVLNLLDGNMQIDNIVYIATTNYVERIEDRYKNRPSRFDRVIEVKPPNSSVREEYFKRKLKPGDLEKFGDELKQWVADTDGMSFAHLKELIASVVVFGNEYKPTIERLQCMGRME
jgi:energy-coupling factor transporter ATP-binding protein EcfA2